jgi:hypothetical protein
MGTKTTNGSSVVISIRFSCVNHNLLFNVTSSKNDSEFNSKWESGRSTTTLLYRTRSSALNTIFYKESSINDRKARPQFERYLYKELE